MPGAREKDLDPNTWIGLSFPLGRSNVGFFNQTKTILEQASYNLQNLLLTMPGERLEQPTFGSNLHSVLFEPDNIGILTDVVNAEIRRVVDIWMPYVNIVNVDLLTDERSPNTIIVKISFKIALNPETIEEITLFFNGG